ncbi:glycosyltransferase [Epilithonimonas sp. JDS]|uniref:glycosyltransferase family 2 protein n=1 Tax=Epilithonimonas sp. JDS TaxID=2902797 RepID=UPI001E534AE1|nr:glycosyltransferase [Epilithonimonas sp. JDS]MCD9854167.1 glycosyltransferase [Epilithonimonas sp. JDS]
MKKISIIIPLYNAEKYIVKCLDSIKIQDYKNFEIIVINDKSKDNSWDVLNQYVSENLNINFIVINNEINLGLSKTRNKGIELATGDYILFMDNDDTLVDHLSLQHFIEATENDPDIVIGKTRFLQNDEPKESRYHTLKNTKRTYLGNEIIDGFLSSQWAVTAWNKLYKTSFINENKLRFLDDLLHEDELWAFETAIPARAVNFLDFETYNYYSLSNPQSMTATMGLRNIEHYLIILEKKLELAKAKDLYHKTKLLENYLKHFANLVILSRVCKLEFPVFKGFYQKISTAFENHFPQKNEFSLSPKVAYYLYKMKYDESFFLYGKLPKYVNQLLKI